MAVATARRIRADRAVKDRILQRFGHGPADAVRKMSYKLPSQPADVSEQQITISPNRVDGFPIPAARESTLKKRKAAKGKGPADLRRSSSTPHLRGPPSGDSDPLSPNSDKRRNKLGYHRTSVACGHCRRRKIRCLLPSPEDHQGRCTNCIRLKKDCNFYPVDQAGPLEAQSKKNAKKEETLNAHSNSSHSSPRLHGQSQRGSVSEMPGIAQSPQPESEIGSGSELPGYGGSSENGVNYAAVPALYSTPGPTWGAPPVSIHQPHSQPRQLQDDPHSPYWSTPVTSTFSSEPVFGQIDAATTNFVNPNYSYHQAQTWAPPSRSLSYSEIQGQGHQYPYNEAHSQFPQHPVSPGYHFSPPHQLNQATFPPPPDPSRAIVVPNAAWNHPPPAQSEYAQGEQHVPVQSVLRSTWYPPAPSYPGVDEKSNPSPRPSSHYYTNVSNPR